MARAKHDGKRARIAVVAPACGLKPETADRVSAFNAAQFGARAPDLHFHPQCFLSEGHFAGPDAARSAAFLEAANDPSFDAVWFARGGYGAGRLDENVFEKLAKAARSKTYLGYSDLGFLLGRLYAMRIGKPVHGPMPNDILRAGGEAAVERALRYLAFGDLDGVDPSALRAPKAVAFNLTILVHLLASGRAPDLAGHAVMVEEVSEHHYRIDRSLSAALFNEKLRGTAGLLLGRCGGIPENDPPFLKTEEEIARYWCARSGVPYLGRADIGHDAENKLVPFGSQTAIA
jgi:muramoyltetrapeptide carboxypeptidase